MYANDSDTFLHMTSSNNMRQAQCSGCECYEIESKSDDDNSPSPKKKTPAMCIQYSNTFPRPSSPAHDTLAKTSIDDFGCCVRCLLGSGCCCPSLVIENGLVSLRPYILILMPSPRSRFAGGGVRVLFGVKTPLLTSQAAVLNSEKRVLMRQPNLLEESGMVSRMAVPTTGWGKMLAV